MRQLQGHVNNTKLILSEFVFYFPDGKRLPHKELTRVYYRSLAELLSAEMSVPMDVSVMAVYSTLSGGVVNEEAARSIVHTELNAVSGVPEDCDVVRKLVDEGHGDVFLVRRALAFSEMNVDDARAILVADREDELAEKERREEEEGLEEADEEERPMKTVTVDFPEELMAESSSSSLLPSPTKPPPAKIEEVVLEGTAESLQKLVIESPVPVLLDIYADWCGPCKQLTPALEQTCVNAGLVGCSGW